MEWTLAEIGTIDNILFVKSTYFINGKTKVVIKMTNAINHSFSSEKYLIVSVRYTDLEERLKPKTDVLATKMG